MKFCTNCGEKLEPEDKFCTGCGTPIADMQKPQAPEPPVAPTVDEEPQQPVVEPTVAPVEDKKPEEPVVSVTPEAPVAPKAQPTPKVEPTSAAPQQPTQPAQQPENSQPTANQIVVDKEAVNEKVDQTKTYAKNYWGWLKSSLQKPYSYSDESHPYYGITTFVIFALIGALMFVVPGHESFNAADSSFHGAASTIMQNPFTFGMFVKVVLFFVFFYAIYVAVGFGIIKLLGVENQKIGFTNYINNFAHFINYTLVSSALALVVTLVVTPKMISNMNAGINPGTGAFKFIWALIAFSVIGFSTGFIATFFDEKIKFKIDKIYVVIIATLVMILVAYFIINYFVIPNIQNNVTDFIDTIKSGLEGNF